jgi:tRNA(Ile)-lysidine synthase
MQVSHQGSPIRDQFSGEMARLGPFEPRPLLAVAVSGGADSLALTVLADGWARTCGGSVVGLIVDHGLRTGSADEARLTAQRLAARGIVARVLTLTDLERGPALAERARQARYRTLVIACGELGALHLLLGHHAGDQAETVAQRALRGSASAGLAGMACLIERPTVRLLRPLLAMPRAALRGFLRDRGIDWVEDPSNRDRLALRSRLRTGLARHDNAAAGIAAIGDAAAVAARARAAEDDCVAAVLAARVTLRPEGFAVLPAARLPVAALRSLIQVVSGAPYAPSPDAVAALAASPAPATLAGVRLLPAGRLGPGLLLMREEAAMEPPIPVTRGAIWDGRFRLAGTATWSQAAMPGATLGALGDNAARFRARDGLPSAVLRTLPALRVDGMLVAVPHLLYPDAVACERMHVTFSPPRSAGGAPFLGSNPALAAEVGAA